MTTERPVYRVGDLVTAPPEAWETYPERTTQQPLTAGDDVDHDESSIIVLPLQDDDSLTHRVAQVRDQYPRTSILTYSRTDDPDAAIDASRLGVEYVSGRRLREDGMTLAERINERFQSDAHTRSTPTNEDPFLESFVRIVSDRTKQLEETLDALLDLGRDRLDLSIGYTSRVTADRYSVQQHRGGSALFSSFVARGLVDEDGSLPLAHTYCRRTVGTDGGVDTGDGLGGLTATEDSPTDEETGTDNPDTTDRVVSFTDPEAAGWDGDPAHEMFGLGSYIGGRVEVNGEVFGSLCFIDERERERPFSDSEELFVELLADWLGRALEKQAAQDERQEAVSQLKRTLERIDDAFFALNEDWEFTYVNEKAATILDRAADELIGTNVWDEFSDALGQKYEENYRRAMEAQETVSFEDYYAPLNLWTEVTAYPSPDGISVFFQDITESRQREKTLKRLLETAEQMQRERTPESVAERITAASGQVLGYNASGVRLYDDDTNQLVLATTSEGIGDRFEGWEPRAPGEGIVGEVYETGETQVWDDLTAREDTRTYHGLKSLVAVPLGDHGVFVVGSLEPNAFDGAAVSVIELLAMNATATLDAQRRQERLQVYESALKNVDDMVCVLDGDGVITYVTDPMAAWLDVDSGGVIGEPLDTVLPTPDSRTVADAIEALPTATPGSVSLRVEHDGGEGMRRGEIQLSQLPGPVNGIVGSLSDTTDLHRTQTKLSRERDRFDRLFERLPDPVMEVSLEPAETIITDVNPAFAAQFGYEASALRGRSIDTLDIHDDRLASVTIDTTDPDENTSTAAAETTVQSLDERVRAEGFVTAEVHRKTVDGPREFLFRGFSYETPDGTRAFGMYTDITDRKRREQYFRVVNRILRHNLRNELNVVYGFASEIVATTDDAQIMDYARRIEATGKRLSDVAEGAAQIRSVVEDGIVTDPDPVRIAPDIESVCDAFAAEHPDAAIDVTVPDDVRIWGDDRFVDAFEHLIENAIVHADSESPRVVVTAAHDPTDGVTRIAVSDDGSGIPDAVKAVVSGDRKVTQLTHNTGIGLWIVAWVVEAYGGEIVFEPGLDGTGTTVVLRIPAPAASDDHPHP